MSFGSNLSEGFQVKYLGSLAFTRKKQAVGISSLQRPLLELYTAARRRGENHRSAHPLALTQQLDIYDYGIVVAGTEQMAGDLIPVVTKVITPISNVTLWAAVRFHARIVKKKVFGAAFVPIACSEGAVDQKSYVQLSAKQRFLVSLTHPSVFACIFRRVSSPTTFECHAFVCATAEEAITVSSLMTTIRQQCDQPNPVRRYLSPRMHHDAIRDLTGSSISATEYTPSDLTICKEDRLNHRFPSPLSNKREQQTRDRLESEEESPSDVSFQKPSPLGERQRLIRAHSPLLLSKNAKRRARHYTHSAATAIIDGGPRGSRPLEAPSESERTETSWEPWHSRLPNEYRSRCFPGGSSTASYTSREDRNTDRRDMATMTDPSWGVYSSREKMELAQTIDLSSETGSSQSGTWHPPTASAVKYTYFGYETFRPPTSGDSDRVSSDSTSRAVQVRADVHQAAMERRQQKHKVRKVRSGTQGAVITGNGTGKVTISVPYRPGSRASSSTLTNTSHVPHGVRSFHRNGHVKNWSTLSQTSDISYQGSATLPISKTPRHNKMIRWSSDDQLPHRHSFLWSLKRLSLHSLTKAKHKTGKFISSVRTKLMKSKKSSEGSEDSAYDTSEVCLSPSGRQSHPNPAAKARRQQSWSFHDLRTATVEKNRRNRARSGSPCGSTAGSTSVRQLVHRRKHRRRRRQNGSSSSDSGVEAYHSDCSAQRSGSDPGRSRVTRVQVQHGMSNESFQRWSHTNIQDELGYIP